LITFGLSHQFQANLSAGSISASVSTQTVMGGILKGAFVSNQKSDNQGDKIMNNNTKPSEEVRNSGFFSKMMKIIGMGILAGTLAGRHIQM
jgi:hypothetical protein